MYPIIKQYQETLRHRLEKRGIRRNLIPGFAKILACSLLAEPGMRLLDVNRRLRYLGWDDFELDYHTLQLAIACFEVDGLNGMVNLTCP